VSQILVVANQTLGGDALVEALQDRMAKGPCSFTLLVPATHRAHWSNTEMMGHMGTGLPPHPGAWSAAEEDDYARARRRLEFGIEQLHRLGAEADGDVGDPNPLKAIEVALARRDYDEIILSTLPTGKSRWLSHDLPHKAQTQVRPAYHGRHGVLVRTVVGGGMTGG
jgi:hypothetical protein